MAIDYNSPAFQRSLLRAKAMQGTNALINTENLTQEFANQQQQMQLAFEQMGLRKYLFDKELELARKELKMDKRFFNKKLRNEEKELFYGLIGGLGTSAMAALEGRRRRKEKKKLARMISA